MNDWQRSLEDRSAIRALLLHAWRLAGIVMTVVWRADISNNHGYVPLLEGADLARMPSGSVKDSEVEDFHFFSTAWSDDLACYLPSRLCHLPEVGSEGWISKRDVSEAIGFNQDSKTVARLAALVNKLGERHLRHEGDLLRICFECSRPCGASAGKRSRVSFP